MPFPFRRIASRLADGDAAPTAAGKGAALEDVVSWTFCSLKGMRVLKRDFVDNAGSTEIDLLLYNDPRYSPIPFLSEFVLIECKNWAQPVNSAAVRDFIEKLDAFRLTVGVLVAANGITGDGHERTAANDCIRRVFDAKGTKVLVINRSELLALRNTEQFLTLIQERFGEVILRSPSIY